MKKLLTVLAITFALISCNKKPDFTKVKIGMQVKDVIELVGEPQGKQDASPFGTFYAYKTHIIVFQADTVVGIKTLDEVKKSMEGFNKGLDSLSKTINELEQ